MPLTAFDVPAGDRYFEDYVEGRVVEFGSVSLDEAGIVAFARSFDPQSMHVDSEKAARGPYNGLIASGWHTVGLMMHLFVDHYLSTVATLASPGVDEVRWHRPVRPGDRLRLRVSILETRPSRSKPDRGMVVSLLEAVNQDDVVVCSLKAMNLLLKRSA